MGFKTKCDSVSPVYLHLMVNFLEFIPVSVDLGV